eukprot:CAMPEP_0168323332 /NCGR_PEP_ID=MMETSP0213-20121227/3422_1 /TAXON_ID=151035 /ORGANISM="Euplotes harpa, Strain FSP1.4" /LENGTH=48 /DNA_ID= /DNA_START= /DNA_END= /DNA_ORIENTATION=
MLEDDPVLDWQLRLKQKLLVQVELCMVDASVVSALFGRGYNLQTDLRV